MHMIKYNLNIEKVSWDPQSVTKYEHFLKKVSQGPMSVTSHDHFFQLDTVPRKYRIIQTSNRESLVKYMEKYSRRSVAFCAKKILNNI